MQFTRRDISASFSNYIPQIEILFGARARVQGKHGGAQGRCPVHSNAARFSAGNKTWPKSFIACLLRRNCCINRRRTEKREEQAGSAVTSLPRGSAGNNRRFSGLRRNIFPAAEARENRLPFPFGNSAR